MDYQVVVIGGGPGGYTAALRTAQLGLKTALIEKDKVGGVCLNQGCIPTKTLVTSAELFHKIKRAGGYGIEVNEAHLDWKKVMDRKNAVVERLQKGIEFLLNKEKITLIKGSAVITAPHTVQVRLNNGGEECVTGEYIILATGSKPVIFPGLGYNGINVVTSEEALNLDKLPSRVVIIGGGVIGCEFASIYAAMGIDVTVIELLPRLLPALEEDLSKALTMVFNKAGVKVMTGTKVQEVKEENGIPNIIIADGQVIPTELVLLSLGRQPDVTGLGLEKVGVSLTPKGRVKVDERLRTNLSWMYAIGDVNDVPFDLAHTASAQGIVAAENIAGQDKRVDYRAVPNCIFTIPEIATVGMSVKEAKDNGYKVRLGRFPMSANGKAVSMGETGGFVLLVTDEDTGRILGAHMMGPHVTDIIAETALAVRKGLTAEDLARTIHAHPTVAETVMEAAETVLRQGVNIE